MEKHNIPQLEAKIRDLEAVCESVGDNSDLVELLKISAPARDGRLRQNSSMQTQLSIH